MFFINFNETNLNNTFLSLKKSIYSTFLTQFPVLLISIFSGILITRLIGPEGKGVYAIFQSNTELFTLFFGLNINIGISYFISKKKHAFDEVIGIGMLGVVFGWSLFLMFIFFTYFLFKPSIFFPEKFNSNIFFVYLILTFFSHSFNTLISALFVGLKKFNIINNIALFNSLLNLAIYTTLYRFSDLNSSNNIIGVFYLAVSVLILNSFIWLTLYIKYVRIKPKFRFGKKFYILFFSFIITAYFSNIINLLNYRLDIWVIEHYMTLKDVGIYSLAVNLGQILWMVTAPITLVLQPYLNAPKETKRIEKFALFSRLNFTLVFLLGIIIYILGETIIPFLYGEEFAASINPLNLLLPGIIISAITKVFAVAIINANKIKYNLLATIIGLIVTLILDFTLIPKYGIIGASLASSISYFAIFGAVFYFLHKKLKYPLENYYLFGIKDFKKIKQLE